ncbi:hypothetical protein GCM10011576_09590 [Micromonospora parathelypteridis]|nr:hypothetical protein GCM10011576_09590 [Micromonospora parathelypteridis]
MSFGGAGRRTRASIYVILDNLPAHRARHDPDAGGISPTHTADGRGRGTNPPIGGLSSGS